MQSEVLTLKRVEHYRLFGEEGFWCNCIFRVERFLVKEAFLCIEMIDAAVGWLPAHFDCLLQLNSKAFVVRGFSSHLLNDLLLLEW